jgi:hypothetical protein
MVASGAAHGGFEKSSIVYIQSITVESRTYKELMN